MIRPSRIGHFAGIIAMTLCVFVIGVVFGQVGEQLELKRSCDDFGKVRFVKQIYSCQREDRD